MADPPHPARAGVAKCLRYIFVGFLSLGFAVGPMVPAWLTNAELREEPADPEPDGSRRPGRTSRPPAAPRSARRDGHPGTEPPRLAAERPLTLRPYSYRPAAALSGIEEAAWTQVVRQLRPAVGQGWAGTTGIDSTAGTDWEGPE